MLRKENVRFSKRKKEIKDLYLQSFSKEERMPFQLMIAMSYLWNTQFIAFYDNDILCGMIYLATIGRQTFIMFFAVESSLRNKGYGSKILDIVQSIHPKNKIIVSIQLCKTIEETDLNYRRKNFYLRNGYKKSGYHIRLAGIEQEVLIKNGEFKKGQFILFFILYSNCCIIPKVWKVSE